MKVSLHILILLGCLFTTYLNAKDRNTEIRAVWLTTNWNLDWPSSPRISAEQQKKELTDILDKLQESNFNTVLFQVRIRGDVFYRSQIEPFSPFFQRNIAIGSRIEYDPLAFVIEECHKRGLECHAWFVTYPIGTKKQVAAQGNQSLVKKHPQLCKLHNGEWYLDPGEPQTRKYILSLVNEIVENYDIDGIHFDYIRYPENAKKFPDNATFRKYGKGKALDQWRRDNITNLVSDIHEQVKNRKPWVQISSSPLGRYKNLNHFGRGAWTAYESVHQDAGLWLNSGLMDAVYPMLYYNEDSFQLYVDEWQKTSGGRFVIPGLGVYRLEKSEGDWSPTDLTKQIDDTRTNSTSGQAYYRAGHVLNNTKGIKQKINEYYQYPAKIPAMQWANVDKPQPPQNIQVYRDENGTLVIEWEDEKSNDQQLTYTLYESPLKNIDTEDPANMIITRYRGNKIHLNTDNSERGVYYTVTASDRYHNESQPDYPVYFILSTEFEK